jgi:hypothetical protein
MPIFDPIPSRVSGASAPPAHPRRGLNRGTRPGNDVVSGRSHDRQRALLMSATGQLRDRLRAGSRGRRRSRKTAESRSGRLSTAPRLPLQPGPARLLIRRAVFGGHGPVRHVVLLIRKGDIACRRRDFRAYFARLTWGPARPAGTPGANCNLPPEKALAPGTSASSGVARRGTCVRPSTVDRGAAGPGSGAAPGASCARSGCFGGPRSSSGAEADHVRLELVREAPQRAAVPRT